MIPQSIGKLPLFPQSVEFPDLATTDKLTTLGQTYPEIPTTEMCGIRPLEVTTELLLALEDCGRPARTAINQSKLLPMDSDFLVVFEDRVCPVMRSCDTGSSFALGQDNVDALVFIICGVFCCCWTVNDWFVIGLLLDRRQLCCSCGLMLFWAGNVKYVSGNRYCRNFISYVATLYCWSSLASLPSVFMCICFILFCTYASQVCNAMSTQSSDHLPPQVCDLRKVLIQPNSYI